ncbi:MAG: polysaccharide biosynthesis C-terminal domain-containing protein, partial [Flavobacteriales bacterium]
LYLAADEVAMRLFDKAELGTILRWFSFAIPVQSLLLVVYGVLRGHKLIPSIVLAENILFPISSISLILLLSLLLPPLAAAISAFFLGHLITLIYSGFVASRFTKFFSKWTLMGPVQIQERQEVNSFAAPLLLSSSADYLQKWADTFMLGILSGASSVGVYAVSMRVGGFIQIPLTAFNMVFAPMISEMTSLGDIKRLADNYKLVTRTVLILSLPIFGIVVLAPVQILSVFGKAFAESHYALILICFGQLINVSVGSTGQMLVMTGRAKLHLLNSLVFLVLTVFLNWLLIPTYGIIGAAIANMVTLGLLNLMRVVQIYLTLKIHPMSVGFFKTFGLAFASLGLVGLGSYCWFPMDGWMPAVFRVSLFVITYGSLVIAFGLGAEEKQLMKKIVNKFAKWKK